jgi:prophage regulatory protein
MKIQDVTSINGERLLRLPAVLAMTGLGRSTLYRLIQQGKFPKPIHPLGHPRLAAWRLSDVQAWINARAA